MEIAAIDLLKRQAQRIKNYPTLLERVDAHRAESESQAERLEGLLRGFGAKPSTGKSIVGKIGANLGAVIGTAAEDEVIKNALAAHAYEGFEIACYRSLVAAAEVFDAPEVARVCGEILREEEAMEAWLGQHIAPLTKDYLQKQALDLEAKR